MKNIDKAIPMSAIILSLMMAFSAYRLLNAEEIKTQSILGLTESGVISRKSIDKVYSEIKNRKPKTVKEIIEKYVIAQKSRTKDQIRILIVPGHDDEFNGAEFDGLKESEINLLLAEKLKNYLNKEKGIDVEISRTPKGYNSSLSKIFEKESEIQEFSLLHKLATGKMIVDESYEPNQKIQHNFAPTKMVNRLYGINQWTDENDFDLVIHVHFNDYASRYWKFPGLYHGFAIYVPEDQLKNSKPAQELAEDIATRMEDYFGPSNMPGESDTIIKTQELIAIGANHTLETPSILIEYDYLYEPQYRNRNTKDVLVTEMAYRTYLGVLDFLNENKDDDEAREENFEKTNLIHDLKKDLWIYKNRDADIISLQAFLRKEGYYPTPGKTLADCPISGYFGECTLQAVRNFQKENDMYPTGFVGKETRALINDN